MSTLVKYNLSWRYNGSITPIYSLVAPREVNPTLKSGITYKVDIDIEEDGYSHTIYKHPTQYFSKINDPLDYNDAFTHTVWYGLASTPQYNIPRHLH